MADQHYFYVAEQTIYEYPSNLDMFEIRMRSICPRPVKVCWRLIYCNLQSISLTRPDEYPQKHAVGQFNPRNVQLSQSFLDLKAKITLDGKIMPPPVMEYIDVDPKSLALGSESDELLVKARNLLKHEAWMEELRAFLFQ